MHHLNYILHATQVIWLVVFFFITYLTVGVYFCRKISRRLRNRSTKISHYIKLAEDTLSECKEIEKNIKSINTELRMEARAITDNSRVQAKQLLHQNLEEGRVKLNQKLNTEENKLLKWRALVIKDMKNYMKGINSNITKYLLN